MDLEKEIMALRRDVETMKQSQLSNEVARLQRIIVKLKETAARNDITDRACCEKIISMCQAALL